MTIPRAKVMSELVAPFTARARLTGVEYTVRFSHLWSAVATRHSDTLDCKFFVNGRSVTVALAHPGFVEFRVRSGRSLTDEEAAQVAATYLRECLEADRDTDRPLLTVSGEDVLGLAEKLGLLA
ncbi:MAG: hypothetical protein ACRD35_07095 [Candidatus Acidiferrales bacterium]